MTPESSGGEQAIREKLVELHKTLFGITYTTNNADINDAYQLYVDSWNDIRSAPNAVQYSNISGAAELRCNWWRDFEIGVGLPVSEPQSVDYFYLDFPYLHSSEEADAYLVNAGNDPQFAKRAWITVMFYMLSHYDYLYE